MTNQCETMKCIESLKWHQGNSGSLPELNKINNLRAEIAKFRNLPLALAQRADAAKAGEVALGVGGKVSQCHFGVKSVAGLWAQLGFDAGKSGIKLHDLHRASGSGTRPQEYQRLAEVGGA